MKKALFSVFALLVIGSMILSKETGPVKEAAVFCDKVLKRPFLVCGPNLPDGQGEAAEGWEWEPTVPWDVAGYDPGKSDYFRETFRKLFALILSQQ